ncbi:RNA-directed DNA polymerase (reverse transcriptase)-related family protein [Rhynchospora pubera]|uniref:RNA-directed DNA polymerase (Reverse transcriptase)-related family protein n=1 Tax=Rhynchospora pubera TaxID=906938 RepID=A0AAV8DVC2_9POAL|nr:RNA-directed DNA polymerase (reverse transcriptase)-related family protein [Rhynchospora pubera]
MKLNLAKSTLVPFNLQERQVQALQDLLHCSSTSLPVQYLGLPLTHRRPDRATFQILIDKLTKRLSGWKARLLSRAGRVVLASSVLSTIPIFFMSVFKLPIWVIRQIDKIRRSFIWKGASLQSKGIHLLSWDRVCLPKQLGGFGLLNLHLHNIALLLRWWWGLYVKPDSQWVSLTKLLYSPARRYAPPLAWIQTGSFFWKDLRSLRPYFQLSVTAHIKNGENTLFWYDNWADTLIRYFTMQNSPPNNYISVKEALPRLAQLLPTPRNFGENQLHSRAHELNLSAGADKLLWRWRSDGKTFSTASVYKKMVEAGKCQFVYKNLWKLKAPPTVRMFLVLLAHDRILTQVQLQKRNITVNPKCVMCGSLILESTEHLFADCVFAQSLWTRLGCGLLPVSTLLQNICSQNCPSRVTIASALWGIWLERNNRTFRDEHRSMDSVLQWIVQQATFFRRFC